MTMSLVRFLVRFIVGFLVSQLATVSDGHAAHPGAVCVRPLAYGAAVRQASAGALPSLIFSTWRQVSSGKRKASTAIKASRLLEGPSTFEQHTDESRTPGGQQHTCRGALRRRAAAQGTPLSTEL